MPFNKIKLVIFLLLFSFLATAQVSETDSLLSLIKKSSGKEKVDLLFKLIDSDIYNPEAIGYAEEAVDLSKKLDDKAKFDALNKLAEVYYINDYNDKAIEFYQQLYDLSKEKNYPDGILKSLYGKTRTYYYSDSIEKSEELANELFKEAQAVDSIKYVVNALSQLGIVYRKKGNLDTSLILVNRALQISIEHDLKREISKNYSSLGRVYYEMANYQKAIECYTQDIQIKEQLNDPEGLAIAYLNFGNTHTNLGNYQLALEQYQKALTTFEKINNLNGVASACNGIGMIYENLSQSPLAIKENDANYKKALEYYQVSLDIYRKTDKKNLEGKALQNIGNTYSKLATNNFVAKANDEEWYDETKYQISSSDILEAFKQSIDYYNQALNLFTQADDKIEIARVNINLGTIYTYSRSWSKAMPYLNKGLQLAKNQQLPYDIIKALIALGESNMLQGNFDQAKGQLVEGSQLANEYQQKEDERYCYLILSKLYAKQGDFKNAHEFYKLSVKLNDEIYSEKSQKAITEMATKYETDKKEAENKLLKNETELQDAQIKRQQLTIIGAIVGSILILVVALLMFRMYREKRKANKILEEKNELISHQKQEITDSIRYASRIQRAVLPSDDLLRETLPEHFVLYLPRDIVSGDFFWLTSHGHKVVIVAADCTGHGVPGAFMSMLGVSFLYEIVNKEGIMQPAAILNYLRIHIKTTLSQKGKADEQKDGMDISLCVLDRQEMKLEWAGAYNPLYLIRKGELMEFKADKMPIAIHIMDHMSFTNHEIPIEKGDTFYISSDGYADQFGGADGRKFMSKKYKEMLVRIWDKPMCEQREIIHKAHLDWKGEHDQVDDILVMGVRI